MCVCAIARLSEDGLLLGAFYWMILSRSMFEHFKNSYPIQDECIHHE